ncbi:hypothetical protein J3R30DRAFT_3427240, partial [Lentinula aciculospora]
MLGRIGVLAILLIDTIGAIVAILSCSMSFGLLNKWLVEALFCWALSSAMSLQRFTIVSSVCCCPVSPSPAVHLSCSPGLPSSLSLSLLSSLPSTSLLLAIPGPLTGGSDFAM